MKDFTFKQFRELLISFLGNGYKIRPVHDLLKDENEKAVYLRHDVDRYPLNALKMANLESELGVCTTYYFRIIKNVYKEDIIRQVDVLGHEVSYHYEDLSICKGDFQKAIEHFKYHLNKFRMIAPAKTICRHGSPLSKWDNKKLWERYNYRDFGVELDTENDIDFDEVFYITDNGWGWNNKSVSVRDKVESKFNIPINNSEHLIELIQNSALPDKIMLNAHPDTFCDPVIKWYINKIKLQSKNIIKRQIVKYNLIK